jgi:hypothetical protein
MKFKSKPKTIEAEQWLGGDYEWLNKFCGLNWGRADAHDISYNDPEQVVVWNSLEQQWLNVPVGHWIIKGLKGELYPCEPEVFEKSYKKVED